MSGILEEIERLKPYLSEQQVAEVNTLLAEQKELEAYRLTITYINEGDASRGGRGVRPLYRTISRESHTLPRHLWDTIESVPVAPFAPSNPNLTCTNLSTMYGDESGQVQLDNLVLMTMDDDTSAMYCYNKDDFESWMNVELGKNIHIHSALEWVTGCKRRGATRDAKILVDPYIGVYIDGVIVDLYNRGCRAFILVKRGHFFIESSFDVSTIHDRNESVYTAVPIKLNVLAGLQGRDALRDYKRRLRLPSTCVDDTRIVMPLEVYQELARRADNGNELSEVVDVEDLLRLGQRYGMDLQTYVREVRHDDPRGCTALTNWMGDTNQEFGEFGAYTPAVHLGLNCQLGIDDVGLVISHNYPFYDTSPGSDWAMYYRALWQAVRSITTEVATPDDMRDFNRNARSRDAPAIGVLFDRRAEEFILNVFNVTDWRYVVMIIAYYSWMGIGAHQRRTCYALNVYGGVDFDPNTYNDRWLQQRGCEVVRCHSFTSFSNFPPPPRLAFSALYRSDRTERVRIENYPHATVVLRISQAHTRVVEVANIRELNLLYDPANDRLPGGNENIPENRLALRQHQSRDAIDALTIPLEIIAIDVEVLNLIDLNGYNYTLEVENVGRVLTGNEDEDME